ncbi:MAG: flagellin [Alphaproteobacteria bacterium]
MPVISTNTAANSALVNLNRNSAAQTDFLTQLSSGSRINSSADDAAGLAVASQLQADITSLEQSSRNASQGQALLQTADGALARQGDILQRMKSLATQYNSGTVDAQSREFINAEYEELVRQIDLISDSTQFNGSTLIDGSYNQNFIVGIEASDNVNVNLTSLDTTSTGLNLSANIALSDYNITTANVARTDGEDVTTSTTISQLTGASEIAAGTLVFTAVDINGDGDTTDGVDIPAPTLTAIAGTDTIQDVLDEINGIVNGDGDQVYDARLQDGQVIVDLANGDIIDPNGDGVANAALTLAGGGVITSTINNFTASQTFDDLRVIDNAIAELSQARSTIGAYTSALERQGENIVTQIENLTAAQSSITDVDIAEAQTNFTNAQVLTEAATAALSQANDMKTSLLQLLS